MRVTRARHLAFLFALSILISMNAWSQAVHDVTITGTVELASGEKVPGVTVSITSPALVTGERHDVTDR